MHPSPYKWSSRSTAPSAASYAPSTTPGPMPHAPHPQSVSLPHPNSAPRYASSSSGSEHYQGSSSILRLNPLLGGYGAVPLYFNVTQDVRHIQLQPGCPQNLFDAPAVDPCCAVLTLSVPWLHPVWPAFEVRNPTGVTARDVLVRIREVLSRSVSHAEMGTMGVKRMDFLGQNVLFAGLERSRDGSDRWVVRFAPGA